MKWTAALTILASTLLSGLSCASAQTAAKATIPFSFHVGSIVMPAGSYKLQSETDRPNLLRLAQINGSADAYVLATTTRDSKAPAKLVFNKYGNLYFLRKTLRADGEDSMTFAASKVEKEIRSEKASLRTESSIRVSSN